MFLIVTFLLHLAAEMTARSQHQIVQAGDEAILPCGNLLLGQDCEGSDWIYTNLRSNDMEQLVTSGRLNVFIKPGRLSVTRNCSLVIKNIQNEDSGRYVCWKYRQEFTDIFLSVVPNDAMTTMDPTTTKRWRTTGATPRSYRRVVPVGAEAALPCGNQRVFQSCTSTDWFYTSPYSYTGSSYQLVTSGRVNEFVKAGRLSLTWYCSLVIKNVQNEDDGRYICRTYKQQNFSVFLSVLPNDAVTTKEPMIKTTTAELRRTSGEKAADAASEAASDCSALDYVMLSMRVAELVLITVITALLFRAQRNVAPAENTTVRRGATVNYVNVGETSASANKRS